jgi:hypothetical protein
MSIIWAHANLPGVLSSMLAIRSPSGSASTDLASIKETDPYLVYLSTQHSTPGGHLSNPGPHTTHSTARRAPAPPHPPFCWRTMGASSRTAPHPHAAAARAPQSIPSCSRSPISPSGRFPSTRKTSNMPRQRPRICIYVCQRVGDHTQIPT